MIPNEAPIHSGNSITHDLKRTLSTFRDSILHVPMRTVNPMINCEQHSEQSFEQGLPCIDPITSLHPHSRIKLQIGDYKWGKQGRLKPQLHIYLMHALRRVFLNCFIKGFNFIILQEKIIVVSTYWGDLS